MFLYDSGDKLLSINVISKLFSLQNLKYTQMYSTNKHFQMQYAIVLKLFFIM